MCEKQSRLSPQDRMGSTIAAIGMLSILAFTTGVILELAGNMYQPWADIIFLTGVSGLLAIFTGIVARLFWSAITGRP